MEKETFDKYVAERYQGQMDFYNKASAKNQKKYKQLQWVLIIFSALTPVFVALMTIKSDLVTAVVHNWLNIAVLLISSTVAILTTGLKTFNYQELWVTYRATYERLKPEIHYYSFNIGPYAAVNADKEALFVSRVELILNAEHTQWPPSKNLNDNKNQLDKDTSTGVD